MLFDTQVSNLSFIKLKLSNYGQFEPTTNEMSSKEQIFPTTRAASCKGGELHSTF